MIKRLLLGAALAFGLALGAPAQIGPIPGMAVLPPPFAAASSPPAGAFASSAVSSTAGTSFTFTSQNIGTADPTRLVVVVVNIADNGATSAADPTSVTIGGTGATKAVGVAQSNSTLRESTDTSIWYLSVAAGTTATIVVNSAISRPRCGIGVFSLTNLSSTTPFGTGSGSTAVDTTGTSFNANLNVPNSGIAVGGTVSVGGASAPTYTWTGLTKSYDQVVAGASEHSGALATGLSATSPLVVSVTATQASILTGATSSWH